MDLCRLVDLPPAEAAHIHAVLEGAAASLEWDARGAAIVDRGWSDATITSRVARLRQALAAAASIGTASPVAVHLPFSGLVLTGQELCDLLARWAQTGEPPVHLLIGITGGGMAERAFRTQGLNAFAGIEIALICAGDDDVRDGLRDLYRLVRHLLLGLALDASAVIGVRGRLVFAPAQGTPAQGNAFEIVDGRSITD